MARGKFRMFRDGVHIIVKPDGQNHGVVETTPNSEMVTMQWCDKETTNHGERTSKTTRRDSRRDDVPPRRRRRRMAEADSGSDA